jgi:mannose/fructose-specific phosphotransferase system component IIA
MDEEKRKEIIGYYADDRNIYCVDCILKDQEAIKKKIEKAITADDAEEELIFCDECKKEIK